MVRTNITRSLIYWITALAIIGTFYVLKDSGWQGSVHSHTTLEAIATVISAMIGILALIRYYANPGIVILFVGTGFIGTALLDGYHAIVTAEIFSLYFPSAPESLIPWSWLASRTYLAIMLCCAWIFWRISHSDELRHSKVEKLVFNLSLLFLIVNFIVFAVVPLPTAYFPEYLLGRPEELIPAFLFGLALLGFLLKGCWKVNELEHWLVMTLLVNFICQALVMSESRALFDYPFELAHYLKIVSYILVLIGLLSSIAKLYQENTLVNTQLVEANKALAQNRNDMEQLALFDQLTGIGNRYSFSQRLEEVIAASDRTGSPFALLIFDLDKFKQVNDFHGHHAGDMVLQEFVQRVTLLVRHSDLFFRIGGDEFALILTSGVTDEGINSLEDRIREVTIAPIQFEGTALQISVSIGHAIFPDEAKDQSALIQEADKGMYVRKKANCSETAQK